MMSDVGKWVQTIREHKLIGRGSCTSIDECWSDGEISEMLVEQGIKSETAAIKWALEVEGMWHERALNASSGEPDCNLKRGWLQWQELIKRHG